MISKALCNAFLSFKFDMHRITSDTSVEWCIFIIATGSDVSNIIEGIFGRPQKVIGDF